MEVCPGQPLAKGALASLVPILYQNLQLLYSFCQNGVQVADWKAASVNFILTFQHGPVRGLRRSPKCHRARNQHLGKFGFCLAPAWPGPPGLGTRSQDFWARPNRLRPFNTAWTSVGLDSWLLLWHPFPSPKEQLATLATARCCFLGQGVAPWAMLHNPSLVAIDHVHNANQQTFGAARMAP